MRTKEERPVRRVREQKKDEAEQEEDDVSPVRQTSKRGGRKTLASKDKEYDEYGVHIATKLDICDCLDAKCGGCWMPCSSCGGTKCGLHCRRSRKFVYSKVISQSGMCSVEQPFHMRRFPAKGGKHDSEHSEKSDSK